MKSMMQMVQEDAFDVGELPPLMANDGKPISDGAIYSAVSRENERKRIAALVVPPKSGLKIYIAGPMSGLPNFNFPAFYAAQALLERHGHECFNPAERDKERHGGIDISLGNETGSHEHAITNHGFSLREALRDDTHYICTTANCIAMLPGWEGSKGARAEHALAHALGHQILYLGHSYVS